MSGNNIKKLFGGIYENKNVLITGHTGFKGSWLALWLKELGANITGYALKPPTQPNHFNLLDLDMNSIIADIRDKNKLISVVKKYKPEIIFHLAAQPLVRESYNDPHETYETNTMGTVNLFEAVRAIEGVKAVLNITTDKCYENNEWVWGYRENDPMGGYDPYSSSKGCSELITSAYRRSFFNLKDYNLEHNTLIASCRAGNVIGGGDWAKDRLIPDIIKATEKCEEVDIRSPYSTRPWQHVLEALYGYLLLGQKLLNGEKQFSGAWNFGPADGDYMTVKKVVEQAHNNWNNIKYNLKNLDKKLHEAQLLKLDISKANIKLKWYLKWDSKKAIGKTINWYKEYYNLDKVNSLKQLIEYLEY